MKRPPLVPLTLAASLCAFVSLMPLWAGPEKPVEMLPITDLVAELDDQISSLKEDLGTEQDFANAKDDMRRAASVVRVLAHGIAEHPQAKTAKLDAGAMEDAAGKLAEASKYAAAKSAFGAIETARKTSSDVPHKSDHGWKDLISMDDLMHVVNTRNSRVRRAARRSRDPEGDALHAMTIALLTLPMIEQGEDYLSEESEIAAWKKYGQDFYTGMKDLSAAFKAKDKAGIQKHLASATKACNDCHAQFRDGE